jgi:gluconate 2-dehydrogenase gamma chain
MPPLPRRQFLSALGAGAVWLSAAPSLLRAAGRAATAAGPDDPWRVLTPEEAEALDAITEQILPTDDTPGAREAQVVRFLDNSLATFAADDLPLFRGGLGQLAADVARRHPDARSFAALPGVEQVEMLRQLEAAQSPFFEAVLVATITGMFANPEYGGNHDKAGWKLIGFEDRFAWGPPFGDYDSA